MTKKINFRVIPRLDIKGPNLVKGIHLEGLRVLGSPALFAKYYYENGADEIIYQDVVASLYERNSLKNIISETAEHVFIPITVGGGIRTIQDINQVLQAGADKVSINTAAIKNPEFIKAAVDKFGSSTIVVAVEVIKIANGNYMCFIDNGREETGIEALEWIEKMQNYGAGEILLTSVDKEGTGEGFELNLISKVNEIIKVPLTVHGGAGNPKQIAELATNFKVDAVAVSSILHYNAIKNVKSHHNSSEGNFNFVNSGSSYNKITSTTLSQIKNELLANKVNVRP